MLRMARRITWAPLASSLPDWRKFWFEDVKNQLVLRIQRDPAGPRITHFLLIGHDLRTADLQEIPLGRIIQMINAGTAADAETPDQDALGVASELRAQADKLRMQADELDAQADALAPPAAGPSGAEDAPTFQADTKLRGMPHFMAYESFVTIGNMEPEPEPEGIPWTRPADRPRLSRPGRGPDRDIDAFYQSVADAYREYIIRSSVVAPAIAKEADVPVGTARTWIKEARRRGFLEQPKPQTRKKQG